MGARPTARLAIGPHLAGYRMLTLRSDSMVPTASAGDLLVVRPQPVSAVAVGQALAFTTPVPGGPVLMHRVVEVRRSGGETLVRTRGDANPQPDPWPARLEGPQAWRLVAVVPSLGWAVGALQSPVVKLVCVWLLPLWLCGSALRALWRPPPARRRTGAAAVLVGVAVVGIAAPAQAAFTCTLTAAPGYASSTLQPPGTVTASWGVNGSTSTATVTWSASPSAYRTGYTVSWTGPTTGSSTAAGSATSQSVTGLTRSSTYTFTVTTTYRSYTSVARSSPVTNC